MSEETLGSIVDQSIGELRRLRDETGERHLKIIASALIYLPSSVRDRYIQRLFTP